MKSKSEKYLFIVSAMGLIFGIFVFIYLMLENPIFENKYTVGSDISVDNIYFGNEFRLGAYNPTNEEFQNVKYFVYVDALYRNGELEEIIRMTAFWSFSSYDVAPPLISANCYSWSNGKEINSSSVKAYRITYWSKYKDKSYLGDSVIWIPTCEYSPEVIEDGRL